MFANDLGDNSAISHLPADNHMATNAEGPPQPMLERPLVLAADYRGWLALTDRAW